MMYIIGVGCLFVLFFLMFFFKVGGFFGGFYRWGFFGGVCVFVVVVWGFGFFVFVLGFLGVFFLLFSCSLTGIEVRATTCRTDSKNNFIKIPKITQREREIH